MTATAKDLFDQAARLRKTLSAAQAQTTELVNMLNTLHFPEQPEQRAGFKCAHCGIVRATDELLNDHLANVHALEPHVPAPRFQKESVNAVRSKASVPVAPTAAASLAAPVVGGLGTQAEHVVDRGEK